VSGTVQGLRGSVLDLNHHWTRGDGASALAALVAEFEDRTGHEVDATRFDNHRLHVKSRILKENPPDVWDLWPGNELRDYVEVGVVGDTTEVWQDSDIEEAFLDIAAEVSTVDGAYYGVPIGLHRINDLYVNRESAAAAGIDPREADTPRELVDVLAAAETAVDGAGLLLPMFDPSWALQLWEVVVLGEYGHGTFSAITEGKAAANREAIAGALEILVSLEAFTPPDALYQTMPDANRRFTDGAVPLYPQGDWAGGYFVDAPGFDYEQDWERIPFPGTDATYPVVMDTFVPSVTTDSAGVSAFLKHVGSPEGQIAYNEKKGSLPVREDLSVEGFGPFARDGKRTLDASRVRPKSITHGLGATSAELIDLKSIVAEFVDDWDVAAATEAIIDVFETD